MKNTIKTDERIFKVNHNFNMCKYDLGNLADLKQIVEKSTSVKSVEHLWNGKFKRISKKDLKQMLEAHRLDTEFLTLI